MLSLSVDYVFFIYFSINRLLALAGSGNCLIFLRNGADKDPYLFYF